MKYDPNSTYHNILIKEGLRIHGKKKGLEMAMQQISRIGMPEGLSLVNKRSRKKESPEEGRVMSKY